MAKKIKNIGVVGIHTDVGKTVVSASLCHYLGADYWKPVQSGAPRDIDVISKLCPKTKIFPSVYEFKTPVSPHLAAKLENINVDTDSFTFPKTEKKLIIEGAGGIFSPIKNDFFIKDIVSKTDLIILVVKNYLGSINHSLMSIEILKQMGIDYEIIVSGESHIPSEEVVRSFSQKQIYFLPQIKELNENNIKKEIELWEKANFLK